MAGTSLGFQHDLAGFGGLENGIGSDVFNNHPRLPLHGRAAAELAGMDLIEVVEKAVLKPALCNDFQAAALAVEQLHIAEISAADLNRRLQRLQQQTGQAHIALQPGADVPQMRHAGQLRGQPCLQAYKFQAGAKLVFTFH